MTHQLPTKPFDYITPKKKRIDFLLVGVGVVVDPLRSFASAVTLINYSRRQRPKFDFASPQTPFLLFFFFKCSALPNCNLMGSFQGEGEGGNGVVVGRSAVHFTTETKMGKKLFNAATATLDE